MDKFNMKTFLNSGSDVVLCDKQLFVNHKTFDEDMSYTKRKL